MYKKMIFCFISFFIGMYIFSQNTVLEVKGVKITSYGNGYFIMELDGIGECIPLQVINSTPEWVEVICSDKAKKVTAIAVGEGVKWAVETYMATSPSIVMRRYAPRVAEAVAAWATKLGHEKLCNYLNGGAFYEVVQQPYSY